MAESFNGKYFSINDPNGVNTVVYRINRTAKELQNQYPKYTAERLLSSEEINQNGTKKTFYVDYPEPEGEDLGFLSFTKVLDFFLSSIFLFSMFSSSTILVLSNSFDLYSS